MNTNDPVQFRKLKILFGQSLLRLPFRRLPFAALILGAVWLTSMTLSAQPGGLDSSFTAAVGAPEQGDDKVNALLVQPDGRVVIAGQFSEVNAKRKLNLARLNPDGTLDDTSDSAARADGTVWALALQPGGKIVIGGWFTLVNGCPCYRVAGLFPDGRLDLTFLMNPGATGGTISRGGFRGPLDLTQVNSVVVQPDDAIFIAGDFTRVNGAPRRYVARLYGASFAPPLFDPKVGSGGFSASFLQTAVGADYALEFKDSLADAVWRPVLSPAEGTVVKAITDPAAAAGQRFYRLRRKN